MTDKPTTRWNPSSMHPDDGSLCATKFASGAVQFGYWNDEECEWENRRADGKWRTGVVEWCYAEDLL